MESGAQDGLDERVEDLRKRYLEGRGYWTDLFEKLARRDPDFVESYLDYSMLPSRRGALEPKVREFLYVAVDIATTHLHWGARPHIQSALKLGASVEELLEVAELAVTSGFHTMSLGCRVLREELAARGSAVEATGGAAQVSISDAFERELGYVPAELESVLALDPRAVDEFRKLAGGPYRRQVLDAKTIEFIRLALDSSTTQLHEAGTREHIRAALDLGADASEILEVLEVASVLGIHGTLFGAALVLEEADSA
jgi:alkylhydroperoxidase/carboxymuconolactone decarboxylase family protein YurZ